MLRLELEARASTDVSKIVKYLAQQDREAAVVFVLALEETLQDLCRFPGLGKVIVGSRKRRVWPHPKFSEYLIFYEEAGELLRVLRVLHRARNIKQIMGFD